MGCKGYQKKRGISAQRGDLEVLKRLSVNKKKGSKMLGRTVYLFFFGAEESVCGPMDATKCRNG